MSQMRCDWEGNNFELPGHRLFSVNYEPELEERVRGILGTVRLTLEMRLLTKHIDRHEISVEMMGGRNSDVDVEIWLTQNDREKLDVLVHIPSDIIIENRENLLLADQRMLERLEEGLQTPKFHILSYELSVSGGDFHLKPKVLPADVLDHTSIAEYVRRNAIERVTGDNEKEGRKLTFIEGMELPRTFWAYLNATLSLSSLGPSVAAKKIRKILTNNCEMIRKMILQELAITSIDIMPIVDPISICKSELEGACQILAPVRELFSKETMNNLYKLRTLYGKWTKALSYSIPNIGAEIVY